MIKILVIFFDALTKLLFLLIEDIFFDSNTDFLVYKNMA